MKILYDLSVTVEMDEAEVRDLLDLLCLAEMYINDSKTMPEKVRAGRILRLTKFRDKFNDVPRRY